MTRSIDSRLCDLEERLSRRSSPTNCPACSYAWSYSVDRRDGSPVEARCFRCDTLMPPASRPVRKYVGVSPEEL